MEKEIKFTKPGVCPTCGSKNVFFGDIYFVDNTCLAQACECESCKVKWNEFYNFVDKHFVED